LKSTLTQKNEGESGRRRWTKEHGDKREGREGRMNHLFTAPNTNTSQFDMKNVKEKEKKV
jgi:hypothetical protein